MLKLLATGATNMKIAVAVGVSGQMVWRALNNIFTKIGVSTRAAASVYALRHGLVPPARMSGAPLGETSSVPA